MWNKLERPAAAAPLFAGWEETLITSALTGTMGAVYGNDPEAPTAAMAMLGDFCFFAGEPSAEAAGFKPDGCNKHFAILTPQNAAWERAIEARWGAEAERASRYAIRKEPDAFDRAHLARLATAVPEGYALAPLDGAIYRWCFTSGWARDWVFQFEDEADFARRGLGFVLLKGGEPVAGASSYSVYPGGIEIEIDTRADHRRRGLALCCGANLILACLERGLYPSWDAAHPGSVALAEKLGYHCDRPYTVYFVRAW